MADHDRNPDTSIIGRDSDARVRQDGESLATQLDETTSEAAGGNVSGTEDDEQCENLDIIFEAEEPEHGAN